MRAADHSEPVALMQGESVERAELQNRFSNLVRNWTALVARQTKLTGFIGGYAQASTVVPVLINSPAFLAGAIPLGTLMQSAFAFQRVEGAFAFCLSAYSKLAEWKAYMDRLWQFEQAMKKVAAQRASGTRMISVAAGDSRDLTVDKLDVTSQACARKPGHDHGPVGLGQIEPFPRTHRAVANGRRQCATTTDLGFTRGQL